ncbi:MFS transporter [Stakelama sp. CBK3Z-3]|uniref:MFS transporter n=1 Tax=Stakelama flava TaxID=2860338 RepID=A0ABS6XM24_9SPHN|nr:MFS transporter [Stakelama flava]MBW4330480.1 MFS transporter [Stakelama flava]
MTPHLDGRGSAFPPNTATEPFPPERTGFVRSLWPLLILAFAMMVGFTMMGSFSTVQESAKVELGLSDYALSLIQGVGAALPLAIFSIPIGLMVDRFNRVRLLFLLALLWVAGTLLTAFAQGTAMLFTARMLTGIGTTGALTAALSIGADVCTAERRGRTMLIVTLGKMLGTAAAFALAGWLFGLFATGALPRWLGSNWRDVHLSLAILAAIGMLPLLFLREPQRHENVSNVHAPIRVVANELWARRRFLGPLFVGQVSVVMADAAAGIWAAPVLSRTYGLTPDAFAGWMGALMFLTGLMGSILGGIAADFGQKSGRRGGILIGATVAAVIGIPAALFPIAPGVPMFALALGLLVLCGTITGLITSAALTVLLPNELRGLSIGAFIAVAGLIGFGVAPTLVAAISDMMGGEAQLAKALALTGTVVSIVSAFAFWRSMRHAPLSATEAPI